MKKAATRKIPKKAPGRKPATKKAPRSYSLDNALPASPDEGYTHAELAQMERFAQEFIVDFNGVQAALRMGIALEKAASWVSKKLYTPYVQSEILRLIRTLPESSIVNRNQVLAGLLKEANREGPDASSASRIAAWTQIGKILGMYVQRIEINPRVGSVMQVPMASSLESWEKSAITAQSQLMEDAKG